MAMDEWVPAWTSPPSALRDRLLAALDTSPFAAPYTTNASAAAIRGIPVFLLGPGDIAQAHVVDEWTSLAQLERAVHAYGTVIRTVIQA